MYVRGCAFDCVDVRMCVDVRVRVRVYCRIRTCVVRLHKCVRMWVCDVYAYACVYR